MPLVAGHILGGALWRITKMSDEEIVYAVDFNLRKERVLNASTFDGKNKLNICLYPCHFRCWSSKFAYY